MLKKKKTITSAILRLKTRVFRKLGSGEAIRQSREGPLKLKTFREKL